MTDNDIVYKPSAAKGLEGNPGKTGKIFSDEASYFKNTTRVNRDLTILHAPDDVIFNIVKSPSGKSYKEHMLVLGEKETPANRKVTNILLDNGYKNIVLLPQIDRREPELRERYYGKNCDFSKCPDAMIDGKRAEFKECKGHYINEHIEKAAQQAQIVVVSIIGNMSDARIQSVIASKWTNIRCDNLERIIILCNGKCFDIKRPK